MWQSGLGLKNWKIDLKICNKWEKTVLQSGWNGLNVMSRQDQNPKSLRIVSWHKKCVENTNQQSFWNDKSIWVWLRVKTLLLNFVITLSPKVLWCWISRKRFVTMWINPWRRKWRNSFAYLPFGLTNLMSICQELDLFNSLKQLNSAKWHWAAKIARLHLSTVTSVKR